MCTLGCAEAALLRPGLSNEQKTECSGVDKGRQPRMGFVLTCSLAGGVASWSGNSPG